ncbi:hypothetical protein [Cellulophaga sp. L1A9]|uniref:hypothetical protein n=1 Tax=Cellulophaga sp. L1A9 TaxID=2686362 RepID=UPI00131AC1D9|nr:hypothetical protein [Cellulophaga sp. L1A9]
MKSTPLKIVLKKSSIGFAFIGLMLLGCTATKQTKQGKNSSGSHQNTTRTSEQKYGFDDHTNINLKLELETSVPLHPLDSIIHKGTITKANEILPEAVLIPEFTRPNILEIKSPVAEKIVENYLTSQNKEPGGHCLSVSKHRFEQAYKEVHGHLPYQDLPDHMASKRYTSKQVFDLLYVSASDTKPEWRSLPEEYRGKGNAGAIAYAGMGTLVDTSGIWSGQLRPGALVQVWRYKEDYELVVKGVDVKKLDPYGHSFVFISYVRDDKNEIVGLKIADQGFQSYRPLVPQDYEVWWAVNLSI